MKSWRVKVPRKLIIESRVVVVARVKPRFLMFRHNSHTSDDGKLIKSRFCEKSNKLLFQYLTAKSCNRVKEMLESCFNIKSLIKQPKNKRNTQSSPGRAKIRKRHGRVIEKQSNTTNFDK